MRQQGLTIGNLIKRAMADKGIKNATDLHELVEAAYPAISYQTITNVLKGKNINLFKVWAIFHVMGLKITYVPVKGG